MEWMMSKPSKVHPTYKTKYRVTNWSEYDRALVRRGDLTIWFTPAALRAWTPLPTGQRGGQPRTSDHCIELGLTLKRLLRLLAHTYSPLQSRESAHVHAHCADERLACA
jgi:hypothetical protein